MELNAIDALVDDVDPLGPDVTVVLGAVVSDGGGGALAETTTSCRTCARSTPALSETLRRTCLVAAQWKVKLSC